MTTSDTGAAPHRHEKQEPRRARFSSHADPTPRLTRTVRESAPTPRLTRTVRELATGPVGDPSNPGFQESMVCGAPEASRRFCYAPVGFHSSSDTQTHNIEVVS